VVSSWIPPGVGDDEGGVLLQGEEIEIAERLGEYEPGCDALAFFSEALQSARVEGEEKRDVHGELIKRAQEGEKLSGVVHVRGAMKGDEAESIIEVEASAER